MTMESHSHLKKQIHKHVKTTSNSTVQEGDRMKLQSLLVSFPTLKVINVTDTSVPPLPLPTGTDRPLACLSQAKLT